MKTDIDFQEPKFTKISDTIWEIDKDFKQGMRVPVRVYATEKLLKGMDSQVFDQISNIAVLPGIEKYAFVMPDGHSGYSSPIGGVAAFDVNNGGIISPGIVGFDINCLHSSTRILNRHGLWKPIKDFDYSDTVISLDYKSETEKHTEPMLILRKGANTITKITTYCGKNILLTKDHPVLTKNGMVKAGELKEREEIAISGFDGVEYRNNQHKKIVTETLLINFMDKLGITNEHGNAKTQILNSLKQRMLTEIDSDDNRLPILIKLMGFVFGDGAIVSTPKTNTLSFYGKKDDLKNILMDVNELGFKGKIYSRPRHSRINTAYGVSEFDCIEHSLHVQNKSIIILLALLGTPIGKKTKIAYRVPKWIINGEKWMMRLFISAYFGAELSKPQTNNGYNFSAPTFSVNKLERLERSALLFIKDIQFILKELGIECINPTRVKGYDYFGIDGKSVGFRLGIKSNTKNLIKFFSEVGYSYNKERERLGSLAAVYLQYLNAVREKREIIKRSAIEMYTGRGSASRIVNNLECEEAGKNFIYKSIFDSRGIPRIYGIERFEEFCKSREIGTSGLVYDKIINIEESKFDGQVYDLSMADENHNFLANGVLVSNCGMRLITTNLTIKDIKPKIKELTDNLFNKVPAGVGSKSKLDIDKKDFKNLSEEGAKWAIKKGYGWKEDLGSTELGGVADWADSSKISDMAISRGVKQIGTLGSGNHYLEIQYIKPGDIKDNKLAKKWGLFPNQVVIMFHTGSRGAGHQIASDYIQTFLSVMESKYRIKTQDKELACAPFDSKEGQDYYKAMGCGVNISFANRQLILHKLREAFSETFKKDADKLGLEQLFDIAHNRASLEMHEIDGENKKLLVHRKGSTGSYPRGRREIPKRFRNDGSPVIIGGSMETGSYLMVGGPNAPQTFNSTAHGSGRTMSRTKARSMVDGKELFQKMLKNGIYVKSVSWSGLAEESGASYKDIDEVVNAVDAAGLSKKVCRFTPLSNVKG
ncbi:RtcB family protein [Candidatus Parvarchaeota archaeon]|nr:RtcB family protein [Candidatus Parvarchaeota archaeon]